MPYCATATSAPTYRWLPAQPHNVYRPDLRYQVWFDSSQRGQPLDPDTIPTTAYQEKADGEFADFISVQGAICISEPVRELIESLEPGRHQFIEISMLQSDKETLVDKKYYALRILTVLDSIDRQQSNLKIVYYQSKEYWNIGFPPRFCLDADAISNSHIWLDSFDGLLSSLLFVSDQFHKVVLDKKLSGFRCFGAITTKRVSNRQLSEHIPHAVTDDYLYRFDVPHYDSSAGLPVPASWRGADKDLRGGPLTHGPRELYLTEIVEHLPDIFRVNHCTVIHEKLKLLIDEYENYEAEFLDIAIYDKDEKIFDAHNYYLFAIRSYLDILCYDNSECAIKAVSYSRFPFPGRNNIYLKDTEEIRNRAIFSCSAKRYATKEFGDRITAEKITGFKLEKVFLTRPILH